MSYLHHSNWKDRPGALVAVIAIHAAVGLVLVKGLQFVGVIPVDDNPDTIFIPADPPKKTPRPEQPTKPEPKAAQHYLPDPIVDLTLVVPAFPEINIIDLNPPLDFVPLPRPDVTPGPAFERLPARPRNDRLGWLTTNDYPSADLRRGNEGVTHFRVVVGSDGRVKSCEVTSSSGSQSLDRAVCRNVTRRARFDPARNERGKDVVGEYVSSVRWQIPE